MYISKAAASKASRLWEPELRPSGVVLSAYYEMAKGYRPEGIRTDWENKTWN